MSFLDPAIRLVGRLTFRQKMHATVLIFGTPLIIALLGFVSTVALAKFLMRGEVIE